MIGTVVGDVVGSIYEFDNIRTKEFSFIVGRCKVTDDSIMALAVADAIMVHKETGRDFRETLIDKFHEFGDMYPYPMGGYGGRFNQWLRTHSRLPYGSCGNGSAMRVAACGFAAESVEEARKLARASADVTHNDVDGIAGAQAVAEAIYLAKNGSDKQSIEAAVKAYYPEIPDINVIRYTYHCGGLCKDTVPQAVACFLQSDGFEDAVRNAVSIGGDSDTLAAITGGMAEAYYGVPSDIIQKTKRKMPGHLLKVLEEFEGKFQV